MSSTMSSSSSTSSHAIKQFLSTSKQQIHESQRNKTPITLVMGNDNADIDTIAATILFSYLRSANPPQGAFSHHYVPLIQTGRSVLSNITHLPSLLKNLHHSGLSLTDLVALDDMSLDGKQSHLSAENTQLFLINWNLLVGRQGENFSKNIAGVIDSHNKDENYVPMNTRPEPRIIGGAGSATALVVNALREQTGERGWSKELAALGLAGILVPTKDLKHNATREDESAYEFLAGIYGSDFDRSRFYHSIVGSEMPTQTIPREPVMPSVGVMQATQSGIEPIQGYRTVAEAPASEINEGGPHQTFTGNRLDPYTNETIKSFHEENLHNHGNELSGRSDTTGYGSSTTTGYETSSTSGYGTTGGASGALSSAAAAVGLGSGSSTSNSQSGYGSGRGMTGASATSTTGSGYGGNYEGSSTSGYGNSGGVSGTLSNAAAAVGLGSGSSTSTTQSGYGSASGLTGASATSTTGSGYSGNYDGAGVGRHEALTDRSVGTGSGLGSGAGYQTGSTGQASGVAGVSPRHESSTSTGNYGSSGLTGSDSHSTSHTGHESGHESQGFLGKVMSAVGLGGHEDNTSSTHGTSSSTSGYGNTSSTAYEGEGVGQTERLAGGSSSTGYGNASSGLGSSTHGTSGLDSESYNSSGGTRGVTGSMAGDAARELKDATSGTRNDKVMY